MYYVSGSDDRAVLLPHLPQPLGVPPLLVTSDIELRFAYPIAADFVQNYQPGRPLEAAPHPADSFVEVVSEESVLTQGDAREMYVLWDSGISPGHIWRRYDRQADLRPHPLAGRGLYSRGVFEVKPSAWLQHMRTTEPENLPGDIVTGYVSPLSPTLTQVTYHHLLFAFRDITLEFITNRLSYELFQTAEQVRQEIQRIKWEADAYGAAW